MHQDQYFSPQQRMSQPPRMLSTKDCAYLTDALAWELLATKKAYHLAQQCSDQQIKHQLEQVSSLHQTHYDVLLNHLTSTQHDHSHRAYPHYQQ
ncbi:MAG: hypothetical protein GX335_04040 [Firmicutes bacterium]|nr:hypothetical protein [Bacillota bacterium]